MHETGQYPPTADQRSWIRPVYGLARGLLWLDRLPALSTQWLVIQLNSLTVAGAVPDSTLGLTGFPFHPAGYASGTPDLPFIIVATRSRGQLMGAKSASP